MSRMAEFFASLQLKKLLMGAERLFLRLTISRKMLLGYLPLSALTIVTAVYALSAFNRLNALNEDIMLTDIRLIEAGDRMMAHLLDQERYGRRYLILKTPDMKALFEERNGEFLGEVRRVAPLMERLDLSAESLLTRHSGYTALYERLFEFRKGDSPAFRKGEEEKIGGMQQALMEGIKRIDMKARQDLNEKTLATARIGVRAFSFVALLCLLSVLLGLGAATYTTHYISSAIHRLKEATRRIAEGRFDEMPEARSSDEIGELATAFGAMSAELKRLKTLDLDASPLTYLPGNTAIENCLRRRIEQGEFFSFCYSDLDNFKAFNDRYGYARGSEVIKATARVVEESVAASPDREAFVGHIGGDDFVVVTRPEYHVAVCSEIVKRFDEMIPSYYDPEDLEKGFIEGKTRKGEVKDFPIMTISIAIVTNQVRTITSHIEVGELAADLKEYVKSLPGSTYVVDRRRDRKLTAS